MWNIYAASETIQKILEGRAKNEINKLSIKLAVISYLRVLRSV
jgi:hypothetical protein